MMGNQSQVTGTQTCEREHVLSLFTFPPLRVNSRLTELKIFCLSPRDYSVSVLSTYAPFTTCLLFFQHKILSQIFFRRREDELKTIEDLTERKFSPSIS